MNKSALASHYISFLPFLENQEMNYAKLELKRRLINSKGINTRTVLLIGIIRFPHVSGAVEQISQPLREERSL